MDIPSAKRRRHPNSPLPVVLPDELIVEILSLLSVKTLMRIRSVSKHWKTLLSNPTFVKIHLKKSARNAHLTLLCEEYTNDRSVVPPQQDHHETVRGLLPLPLRRLLENPSITVANDTYCSGLKEKDGYWFVGSCNGLVCFFGYSVTNWYRKCYRQYWLCFWNPAMRTRSDKLGYILEKLTGTFRAFRFSFGYDNSTETYKVVAFRVDGDEDASWRSEVKVLSLKDNFWRKIQSFPVFPLNCLHPHLSHSEHNHGVHLSGTINWLALRNNISSSYYWKHITNVEQFLIVSLDLSTETYTLLLMPQGFDEVPREQPTLRVLLDCLCFSHDFKGTEFVIWQMKEFGIRESWTQLLKISYWNLQMQNLPMDDDYEYPRLLPLYLSQNGDTLILANDEERNRAIVYNGRDNRVEKTRMTNEICWFSAMEYVESLVSTRGKLTGIF